VPNRVDTRFNLGSMNKMFTAVAIAQLVERGKLSFDDPVSRYLPGYVMDMAAPRLAVGYEREMTPAGPRWHNNLFEHAIRGGPAGGGYSTAEDLLRFGNALRGGKLLGQKSLDLLFSPKPELNSPFYGYGFGISDGGAIVGHSGGFTGISANLDLFLRSGYTAVVLSNYSEVGLPVTQEIRRLLARVTKGRETAAH
jgi:CubicO group peptidase (beta-lactamase class C family)